MKRILKIMIITLLVSTSCYKKRISSTSTTEVVKKTETSINSVIEKVSEAKKDSINTILDSFGRVILRLGNEKITIQKEKNNTYTIIKEIPAKIEKTEITQSIKTNDSTAVRTSQKVEFYEKPDFINKIFWLVVGILVVILITKFSRR